MNDGHTGGNKHIAGDAGMTTKKKGFRINIIRVGNQSDEIIRSLVKERVESVLAKNGAVSHNLDEVLHKYISEEMRNEQKG